MNKVIDEYEDDTEAVPISLNQFKVFDRVGQRFLTTALETAGFELDLFCKFISSP